MSLTIYGTPASRAFRVLWAAHELALPFELVPHHYAGPETKGADYLAINPNGTVPAIVDDGVPLFESLAINLYLARKAGRLWPAGIADEGRLYQWTLWAAHRGRPRDRAMGVSHVLPAAGATQAGARGRRGGQAAPAAGRHRRRARPRRWLAGDDFTIADLNVAAVLYRAPGSASTPGRTSRTGTRGATRGRRRRPRSRCAKRRRPDDDRFHRRADRDLQARVPTSSSSRPSSRAKLARGKPLRIKVGLRPDRARPPPRPHGVFNKLRQFQDLGHQVIFLIGDFTGAASATRPGATSTRPPLTREEIARQRQDLHATRSSRSSTATKTEVAFNSEWLDAARRRRHDPPVPPSTPWRGCSSATTSPSATRSGQPIAIHEFLYPLVQGYDSVALKADVELGGTDQKFNLLVGRELQRALRAGAAVHPDAAAARGARRRQQDVEVARQLRRHHRGARTTCSAS